MSPVIIQLSLPYNNTNCTAVMYSTPRAQTVAPVFVATFPNISHYRRDFQIFWYRESQLLLL